MNPATIERRYRNLRASSFIIITALSLALAVALMYIAISEGTR